MSKTLVVDDGISGFLTKAILELEGYPGEIYLAEHVEEALQLLGRERFSLIITELETQHLANCEFLDALGHLRESRAVPPVVILTHSPETLDKVKASRYPMVRALLSKPLDERSIGIIGGLSTG